MYEAQENYIFEKDDPWDINSELLESLYLDEIITCISNLGHEVILVQTENLLKDYISIKKKADYVFNMSKGYKGSFKKSIIPSLLEIANVPYLGSDPYVLSFVRNKAHLKAFASYIGIPSPLFKLVHSLNEVELITFPNFPLFVKPCFESASIGITESSIVEDKNSLIDAVRKILKNYHQPALVEEFILGKEVSVPIIGNSPNGVWGTVGISIEGEEIRGKRFLTSEIVYRYKYGFKYPVILMDNDVEKYALSLYNAVGIRDYGRVDFRVTDENVPYLLEASTHPHIGKHSSFYIIAKSKNMTYQQLIGKILETSFNRVGLQ